MSLLTFLSSYFITIERGVIKSSTILNLFPYICQFLLYNFEALLSGVSPWWLSPFMFTKYPSLSLVILFILKSTYLMLIQPYQDLGEGWSFFGGEALRWNDISFSVFLFLTCPYLYTHRVSTIKSILLNLAFLVYLLRWLALWQSSFYFYSSLFPFIFLKKIINQVFLGIPFSFLYWIFTYNFTF